MNNDNVLQFTTTINCQNCIRAVTNFLNEVNGIEEWEVDTSVAEKILTVKGKEVVTAEVIEAVEDAGFDIKPL